MDRSYWLPSVLVLLVCALVSIAAQDRAPVRQSTAVPAVASPMDPGDGIFNVRSPIFGALGNGTADDTAAIQRAIDRASAAGGTVYFPAGAYRITKELL